MRDRAGGSVGLLLIDIDFFKSVNDRYGHGGGDDLLAGFADRLRGATRPGDTVARWGGEEFVVLLSEVGEDDVLLDRAEQIREDLGNAPFHVAGQSITVHVSIGAARSGTTRNTPDSLMAAADNAMYAAKRGRPQPRQLRRRRARLAPPNLITRERQKPLPVRTAASPAVMHVFADIALVDLLQLIE